MQNHVLTVVMTVYVGYGLPILPAAYTPTEQWEAALSLQLTGLVLNERQKHSTAPTT